MGSGRRRSPLPALLVLLVLLVLPPAAWSDCGPLPTISHAEPPEDSKHQGSFSVGSRITYSCHRGYIKRPLLSDTIQCLTNSQWSNLPEFCGRSCLSPPRVHFARISQEDEIKNFYAVNVTVKYNCRPGYENTTAQLPTSMCLDDLSWSEVPELCRRKSCGIPENPEYGKVITSDHLFGARAEVVCNRGYTLKGASRIIRCSIRGSEVGWSQLPTCQAISCSPPPAIRNGTHNGSGTEEFTYNSVVMYTCEPGLQLVGNETLHCTTENQVDGVWSGSPPECRVSTTAATNQTKPSEEKIGGNPYWLVSILIPSCIVLLVALGILAGIIMRCNDNKIQSYDMGLQKHEMKGRDPPTHPKGPDDEKQPLPWHSYFCHTTSCHVCPTCEEQLHAALAPHAKPPHCGCAACEDWLSAQPGTPRTYSVPSIGGRDSQSPAGTSSHHICPICENWLRAHLGQCDSATPGGRPGGLRRQDESPWGPVCPPCTDRLHISLVHSDRASCPVCPLAGEGTLAHLVSHRTPSCHVCPVCAVPTHAHLCQPQHPAPNGQMPTAVAFLSA